MKDFSSRLKAVRKERKLKQHEVAVHLHLSDSGYQCYEQGKGFPDVPRLYELAEFLDVSIDYLLGRTEQKKVAGKI